MEVERLLKKYNLLDDNIKRIAYHTGTLRCDSSELVRKILNINDLKGPELATTIYTLILRCDYYNPAYNKKLDEEMTRFGMQTDKYDNNRPTRIWHRANMIDDSDYGTNKMYTDMIDDQIDFQSDFERFRK